MALPPAALDRFVKLCGYLGSDNEHERSAAAAKATALLREHQMTWEQAIKMQPSVPQVVFVRKCFEYDEHDWREIAASAAEHPQLLSEWERKFIVSLSRQRQLSPRQHEILEKVASWLWHKGVVL